LCFRLAPQQSDICPRFRAVAASNQDDFLHLLDSKSKPSSESEPGVDMLYYPLGKITPGKGVLTLSPYWNG
jgi:hypothetical protein